MQNRCESLKKEIFKLSLGCFTLSRRTRLRTIRRLDILEQLKGVVFKNMAKRLISKAEAHLLNRGAQIDVHLFVITRGVLKVEGVWTRKMVDKSCIERE